MNLIRVLPILLVLLVGMACSNNPDVLQLNPTELEVTVLDKNGLPKSNAEVRIYRNRRDWESLSREVDIQVTDASGVAYFTDLQSANYYFFAAYEEGNGLVTNQFLDPGFGIDGSNYELADYLTDNAITRVSVNAIYDRPQSFANFEFFDVQAFFESNSTLSEISLDTVEIAMLFLINYDPFDDVNNQLGNQLDEFNTNEFYDLPANMVGDYELYTPIFNNFYTTDDIINGIDTYDMLFFEINQADLSYYNEPYGGASIQTAIYNATLLDIPPYRLKDAGSFQFGSDNYTVDLIVDWL